MYLEAVKAKDRGGYAIVGITPRLKTILSIGVMF